MILDARDKVLDVIETRFKKIPDDISVMVNRISDRGFHIPADFTLREHFFCLN